MEQTLFTIEQSFDLDNGPVNELDNVAEHQFEQWFHRSNTAHLMSAMVLSDKIS